MEYLPSGCIQFAVRLLDPNGVRCCKIGIMRAFPTQSHLYGNRVAIISKIVRRVGDQFQVHIGSDNDPIPFEYKRRKARGGKTKKRDEGDKTLELVKDCHGVAVVTFLDGGMCTTLPINSEPPPSYFDPFWHHEEDDGSVSTADDWAVTPEQGMVLDGYSDEEDEDEEEGAKTKKRKANKLSAAH